MKLMSNLSIFGTQSKWNIKENTHGHNINSGDASTISNR